MRSWRRGQQVVKGWGA